LSVVNIVDVGRNSAVEPRQRQPSGTNWRLRQHFGQIARKLTLINAAIELPGPSLPAQDVRSCVKQEIQMRYATPMIAAVSAVFLLAACSSTEDTMDRSALTQAQQDAAAAKAQAAEALAAARRAAEAAQVAQLEAKTADEKASRMFEHSLRKQ
jgi:hypothetical protein